MNLENRYCAKFFITVLNYNFQHESKKPFYLQGLGEFFEYYFHNTD